MTANKESLEITNAFDRYNAHNDVANGQTAALLVIAEVLRRKSLVTATGLTQLGNAVFLGIQQGTRNPTPISASSGDPLVEETEVGD